MAVGFRRSGINFHQRLIYAVPTELRIQSKHIFYKHFAPRGAKSVFRNSIGRKVDDLILHFTFDIFNFYPVNI